MEIYHAASAHGVTVLGGICPVSQLTSEHICIDTDMSKSQLGTLVAIFKAQDTHLSVAFMAWGLTQFWPIK